jgi:O-methyltransferase involved in polyketide biosynthesis
MVSQDQHVLQQRLKPALTGVQETMLWALYERANEAIRPDGLIHDPECVRIFNSIDYDCPKHFGPPSGRSPARAAKIDAAVRKWLAAHPCGFVVSLGEGLETQVFRVDNGTMTWLTIDLPDAIEFRECFIKPTRRLRHLAMSAFDTGWMDHVDTRFGVFIIAQGLLMYFAAKMVRQLLVEIATRFPGAEMIFDMLPREATQTSHQKTPAWTSPPMPWGLDRNEVTPTLRAWLPGLKRIRSERYREADKRSAIVEDVLDVILPRRRRLPCLVHVNL